MNKSPGSTDDPTFWVPPIQRQTSACPSDCNIHSADESLPGTPTSPTSSLNSMALSIGGSVPIARTDKHVVLAMSPARPKVSSMQAKLDHTKIDTSLYDNVCCPVKYLVNVFLKLFTFYSSHNPESHQFLKIQEVHFI